MPRGELPPFSRELPFRVAKGIDKGSKGTNDKSPEYAVDDEITFLAIRLAKSGYFGGDPLAVMNGRVDIVEDVLAYEKFELDYEKAYIALNAPASS